MKLDAMIVLQNKGVKELLGLPENSRMDYILGMLNGYSMEEYILDMVDFYDMEQEKADFIFQAIQDILVKENVFEDNEYLVYMLSLQYVIQNFITILPKKDKCDELSIEKILPVKSKRNAQLLIILEKSNSKQVVISGRNGNY